MILVCSLSLRIRRSAFFQCLFSLLNPFSSYQTDFYEVEILVKCITMNFNCCYAVDLCILQTHIYILFLYIIILLWRREVTVFFVMFDVYATRTLCSPTTMSHSSSIMQRVATTFTWNKSNEAFTLCSGELYSHEIFLTYKYQNSVDIYRAYMAQHLPRGFPIAYWIDVMSSCST